MLDNNTHVVEIPNPEREDFAFEVLKYFSSREEALAWAIKYLGADENGNINVISSWITN